MLAAMQPPVALKRALKRSKWATVAGRIYRDRSWLVRERLDLGNPTGAMGNTHSRFDLAGSVDYIDRVFNDYLRYGGIEAADLQGKAVLELGPGESYGVALRFLAAGARHVQAVERVLAWSDPDHQRQIYTAIVEGLAPAERERAEAVLDFSAEAVRFDPAALSVREGLPFEQAAADLPDGGFDLIVSRAVVEHIFDTDTAFAEMARLLAPGGVLAHKIDIEDHGLFTGAGLHPLTFMTIPGPLYRLMIENTGQPNRKPLPYYRRLMEKLGLDARFYVTNLIGRGAEVVPHLEVLPAAELAAPEALVEEIRPQLVEPFRSMTAADLSVSGVFLIARRP
jgi:SAM-dependent methyltransferase